MHALPAYACCACFMESLSIEICQKILKSLFSTEGLRFTSADVQHAIVYARGAQPFH